MIKQKNIFYKISLFLFLLCLFSLIALFIDTTLLKKETFIPKSYTYTIEDFETNCEKYKNEIKHTNNTFLFGPYSNITKGIYEITITYNAEVDTNIIVYPKSNSYSVNPFESESIFLDYTNKERKFELRVNQNIEDFELVFHNATSNEENKNFILESVNINEKMSSHHLVTLFSLCLTIILGFITLFLSFNETNKKKMIHILVISFLSSIIISYPYLIQGHDLSFHLLRIDGIANELKNGVFPVKMQTIWLNGAGYPVSSFYGDTLLYIPALLRIMGLSITNAYRLFLLLLNLTTTTFVYLFTYDLSNKKTNIALLCTSIYILSPYRLCCMYLRASIGEVSAMLFIPFVVYAFINVYIKEKNNFLNTYVPLSIGVAGLFQTHIISLEMTAFFCIVVCILFLFKKENFKKLGILLLGALNGLLLSIWFVVPFFDLMKDPRLVLVGETSKKKIQNHGLYLPQLLQLTFNGNGSSLLSTDGIANEMPLGLGIGCLFGIVYIAIKLKLNKKDKKSLISIILFVLAIISIIMTTLYFPWDYISNINIAFEKVISSIQFPWRLLTMSIVFITFSLACFCHKKEKNIYTNIYIPIITIVTILFGIQFQQTLLLEKDDLYKPIEKLSTNAGGGWEYLSIESDIDYILNTTTPTSINCEITSFYRNEGKTYVNVNNIKNDASIIVPVTYDRYYKVMNIDTNKVYKTSNHKGLTKIILDNDIDNANILICFNTPNIWIISYYISLFFIVLFFISIFAKLLKEKGREFDKILIETLRNEKEEIEQEPYIGVINNSYTIEEIEDIVEKKIIKEQEQTTIKNDIDTKKDDYDIKYIPPNFDYDLKDEDITNWEWDV